MASPENITLHQYQRKGMIHGASVIIPTRILIQYRFKKFASDDVDDLPVPILQAYGVKRNDTTTPVDPTPLTIPTSGKVLLPAGTYSSGDSLLETSMIIELDEEYLITGFVAQINGMEHLARVRKITLFARQNKYAEEQEYELE